MKMFHIPLLSLLVTGLTFVSVQGEDVHIIFGLRSSVDSSSRKCLNVKDSDISNGTPVQIYECDGDTQSAAQSWGINATEAGPIWVDNSPSYCLDAIDIHTSNKVELWECNESPQQQWFFAGNLQIQLAENPDMCLDVPKSVFADGVQVETYSCNDGNNQVWQPIEDQ